MVAIIILIAVGVLLVLLEIVMPGGVMGTLGILCILAAIVLSFLYNVTLGLGVAGGTVVFGLVAFWAWLKYLPRLPGTRRMFLHTDASDWHGVDTGNRELLGKEGVTHTRLRPSGIVLIGNERVDVLTQGDMIEKGKQVRVIKVEGNQIVVALIDSPTARMDDS